MTDGRVLPGASRSAGPTSSPFASCHRVGAERLRELHEVGIAQLGAELTTVEALPLIAVGVAVRPVVIDDGDPC